MPRDWKKIETDYMGGNLSYAKIAEKWGVSVRQVEEHGAKPLSDLTGGIHLHTLRCPDQEVFQRVITALDREGFLLRM